jgi:integrase
MKLRGDGRTFARGPKWWIAFYVDGKEQRESAKTTDPEKAEKYLRRRLKEVHAHEFDPSKPFVSRHDQRRAIAELMDALKVDFKLRGIDSPQNLSNIARARADFGNVRAASLTAEQVDRYIEDRLRDRYVEERLEKGSAKASVNRVTQLLKQAYKLAELPAPRIRKLSEKGNERQGFFSESEIRSVIENLPADLRDFTLFGWLTGMRKGEIASLAWEDVDGDVIRLRAENAKTGEARMIPLEGELGELIERRRGAREIEIDKVPMIASLIFHRAGDPVGDIRKAWATACKKAGIRRLFHDLRRSACRNMIAAGVAQSIAMKVSGHKTDSMFRRYAIAAETDLRSALRRTQEHLKTAKQNVIAMPAKRSPASERGQLADNEHSAVARRARK